jgi:protein-export membrane protein SecD/preprotein translocase SecF subunit
MRDRRITTLILIIILIVAVAWVDLPTNPGIHLDIGDWTFDRDIKVHQGLDLQGGLQVLLEAEWPAGEEPDPEKLETARVIIENRVNGLGVVEPLVQTQGDRRIIVELPGIEDEEMAIATVRETGLLEFVDVGYAPQQIGTLLKTDYLTGEGAVPEPTATLTTTEAVTTTEATPSPEPTATVTATEMVTATETITSAETVTDTEALPMPQEQVYHTVMTGEYLETAVVSRDQLGTLEIQFELDSEGARIFDEHTRGHIEQFLCIVLDKQVISCPRIQTAIPDGRGRITGGFSLEQARKLAVQLRYGSLPVALRVETTRKVGPTLGQESVQKSIRAGAIGLAIVLLFMLIYYRLPGLLADLALVTYALINFAAFKLVPVTLTLPGITGFLLSTGMAVDANILIFERMKEELRAGRSLWPSLRAGFDRAWTSIRDSNISTLITCAILAYFGSNFGASMVRGFAITLFIGVVVSMFTAVLVTRSFMENAFAWLGERLQNTPWLLGVERKRETPPSLPEGSADKKPSFLFDIVGRRKWYFVFSGAIIALGIAAMIVSTVTTGAPVRLSVDFTGGSLLVYKFTEPGSEDAIRGVLTSHGVVNPEVRQLGDAAENTWQVRSTFIDADTLQAIEADLEANVGSIVREASSATAVSPAIGGEVTQAASVAVVVTSLVILAFIWWAFRGVPRAYRYGVSAIAAMIHDVLVALGFFALFGLLFGWEVDALFLTAILTVIGFSVQDTIVVFDRIRENIRRRRSESFERVANRSILETIHRSLATQLNAIFVMIALLLFGGASIQQFIATLLVGMLSGTYSSIFVAVPLLVVWEKGEFGRLFRRSGKAVAKV